MLSGPGALEGTVYAASDDPYVGSEAKVTVSSIGPDTLDLNSAAAHVAILPHPNDMADDARRRGWAPKVDDFELRDVLIVEELKNGVAENAASFWQAGGSMVVDEVVGTFALPLEPGAATLVLSTAGGDAVLGSPSSATASGRRANTQPRHPNPAHTCPSPPPCCPFPAPTRYHRRHPWDGAAAPRRSLPFSRRSSRAAAGPRRPWPERSA